MVASTPCGRVVGERTDAELVLEKAGMTLAIIVTMDTYVTAVDG
jgi:hypothetical protein